MNATAPTPPHRPRIGEMLVAAGLITTHQLEEALDIQRRQGGKTVANLIMLQHLSRIEFLRFLAQQPGMASIEVLNCTIPKEVACLIPADFALKHEVIPIDKMGQDLTVAMACPLDKKTIGELSEMTGLRIQALLVSDDDIAVALRRYYSSLPLDEFRLDDKPVKGADMARSLSSPLELAKEKTTKPQKTPPKPSGLTLTELRKKNQILGRVDSALTLESIKALVAQVENLPALPETVHRIQEAIKNPEIEIQQVAEILKQDPALSAKVLGLANSSSLGFSHHIDTIERATILLGLQEIFFVTLSAAVVDYFSASKYFDYKAFWERSLCCAAASRVIGQACGRQHSEGLFSAGLLHDIGRVVFAEIIGERYAEIDQSQLDFRLIAQENAVFSISHPELGYLLAQNWGLPVELWAPIRYHHMPTKATECQGLVAVVALASEMADHYEEFADIDVADFALHCKVMVDLLEWDMEKFMKVFIDVADAMEHVLAESGDQTNKG